MKVNAPKANVKVTEDKEEVPEKEEKEQVTIEVTESRRMRKRRLMWR